MGNGPGRQRDRLHPYYGEYNKGRGSQHSYRLKAEAGTAGKDPKTTARVYERLYRQKNDPLPDGIYDPHKIERIRDTFRKIFIDLLGFHWWRGHDGPV